MNRGSGIQHIALQTRNIVQAIAQFLWCTFPASTPQLLCLALQHRQDCRQQMNEAISFAANFG